jgi:hypothetical protein
LLFRKEVVKWRGNMKLVLSIVFSIILAFVLFWFAPFIANIMAFGIIGGCIFRGLYLLNDIHGGISSFPRSSFSEIKDGNNHNYGIMEKRIIGGML